MKNISLYYVLAIIFSFPPKITHAQTTSNQQRNISLWGHVRNSFTTRGLVGAKITLMTADSTVIDSIRTWKPRNDPFDGVYKFSVPARPQKFIIRAEYPEYETTDITFDMKHIARNTWFDLPHHFMKYQGHKAEMERNLNEVTVTATKVQMVFKGDTVVYNADAFNVPEGSMLDGLIRQLPGVELKDNGEIYVNGRKVDYLTLNGADFFKGNNKMMLDNLPYYTVENIQVYNKTTEKSEWLGVADAPKDFVMDIRLKREYAMGYIVNTDIGGGTKERYVGKAFGMQYSDHARLTLFANLNNTTEMRRPGNNGEWNPTKALRSGEVDYKTVGGELYMENKEKTWKEVGNVSVSWEKRDLKNHVSEEQFLSGGNIYDRTRQEFNDPFSIFSVNLYNKFTYKGPFWVDITGGFFYWRNKGEIFIHSASFSKNPSYIGSTVQILDSVINSTRRSSFMQDVINTSQTSYHVLEKNMNYNFGLNLTHKLLNGDDLDIRASFRQDKNKKDDATQELVTYPQGLASDKTYRHLWQKNRENKYVLQGSVRYTVHALNRWNYRSYIDFDYSRTSSDNPDYRLDYLDNYGPDAGKDVGTLPSTRDSLARTLDTQNSAWSTLTWHRTRPGLYVYYNKEGNGKSVWFEANVPLDISEEKLNYRTAVSDTTVRLQTVLPAPMAKLEISTHNYDRFYRIQYNMNYNTGDLYSRVDIRNDANPLYIRLGNPDLKKALTHKLHTRWRRRNRNHDQTLAANLDAQFTTDAIAYGYTYNPENGVRTYRYENVDGNWNASGRFDFSRALDKNKRWRIQTGTSLSFIHNVDIAATQGETGNDRLSKVDTWRTGQNAILSYRFKSLSVGVNGTVDWRNSQSDRPGFETVNAVEYNYGMTATCTLPWKIQLATDIKMFSRRGYSDHGMNTDDVVWNASLARSFAKEHLTVRLEGYDILNQISNTLYSINAQGRKEVWINNIPSYVMLHLQWKFNHAPKKK